MSMVTGKILIVDDFRTNITYLKCLLENEGHEIHSSQQADIAMEIIKQVEFDLVLLDIEMPKTDGFNVCEFIRKSVLNSKTPVIFLTSKNDKQSVLHGFDIGAQDYITRPFHDKELLARVNTHIELKIHRAMLEAMNKDLEKLVAMRTRRLRTALQRLHISYQQLDHAKNELESLDHAKENFLRMINHEIRTPLNGILGFHKLLKETNPDGKFAEYLNMMNESVRRLEKFSLQALLITQLKTGKYFIEKTDIDIDSQIKLSISELKASLDKKNLIVHCEIENAVLYEDLQLFHYALFNLIENAIRSSYAGGSIKITGRKQSDSAYYISIIDTGKGLPASVLKNANCLFSDDDFIDENPGLAIYATRLILEKMQGDLRVENNPPGGTAVQMIFSLLPGNQISGDTREFNINISNLSEKIHESC
jgi:two-component system sensor histidine kinase/response regulator